MKNILMLTLAGAALFAAVPAQAQCTYYRQGQHGVLIPYSHGPCGGRVAYAPDYWGYFYNNYAARGTVYDPEHPDPGIVTSGR